MWTSLQCQMWNQPKTLQSAEAFSSSTVGWTQLEMDRMCTFLSWSWKLTKFSIRQICSEWVCASYCVWGRNILGENKSGKDIVEISVLILDSGGGGEKETRCFRQMLTPSVCNMDLLGMHEYSTSTYEMEISSHLHNTTYLIYCFSFPWWAMLFCIVEK